MRAAHLQDVLTCALSITSESLAPIFLTSAVTGQGLALLRLFVDLAPLRRRWGDVQGEPAEFMIDETFGVPGVGTVVAGTLKRGTLNLHVRLAHSLPSIMSAKGCGSVWLSHLDWSCAPELLMSRRFWLGSHAQMQIGVGWIWCASDDACQCVRPTCILYRTTALAGCFAWMRHSTQSVSCDSACADYSFL